MADTQLRMVVEADTSSAEAALDRTGTAANDAADQVDDAGERTGRGFDRMSTAAGEAEDKAEGFAYMLTGAASAGIGFAQIMEGDVFAGTVMMAMGIADLSQGIAKFAIPAIKAMTLENIKSTAVKVKDTAATVANKVATVASAAATKAMAAAQWVLNAAMRANPIGIVITLIAALVAGIIYAYRNSETFRRIVDTALKVVAAAFKFLWNGAKAALDWIGNALSTLGGAVKGALVAAFKFMVNMVLGYFGMIINGAAKLLGWVPGLGPKLKTAANEFNKFRDNVNRALDGINDETVNVNVRTVYSGGAEYYKKVAIKPGMGGRALGGPVVPGGMYIVGEQGPEILDLTGSSVGGYVHNNRDSQAVLRGVGGGTHVHIHTPAVITGDRDLARLIDQAMTRLGRSGQYVPRMV